MQYVELAAIVAVLQFLCFGALTGRSRRLSGLRAPAVQGHEGFERMYRMILAHPERLHAWLRKHKPPTLVASCRECYNAL